MSSWKGKTKGSLLGHKIFVFFLKFFGIRFSYFILRFVALYYVFFSWESNRCSFFYFNSILKYGWLKSYMKIYRNYYIFGQTILDKVALMADFTKIFNYDFEGEHYLVDMVKNKTGGILISGHVGNWEIAGHLLKRLQTTINIVMYDAEYQKIKDYLGQIIGQRKVNIIPVSNDLSHIFLISNALRNKEIICMHADRFVKGSKVINKKFMGEDAEFPLGPFTLAAKFKVPVSFVFAMKEGATHYHLSATPPKVFTGDETLISDDFIKELENKVKQYPEQWFNYYQFWKKPVVKNIISEARRSTFFPVKNKTSYDTN